MEHRQISVVIPTYNRAQTLPRAINSVINQSYQNWELLIVDDGSTDNTEEVVDENYSNDQRIAYIKRPNSRPKGANACRNIGAEKSQGKYVAFLDSDDEWLPHHLEHKLDKLKASDAHFNFGAFLTQRISGLFEADFNIKNNEEDIENYLLSNKAGIRTSTFLLERERFLSVKFDENLGKHQDWDFALRYCKDQSFLVNQEPTVKLYISHDRMSSSRNHKATLRFLGRHKGSLKRDTYKKFLTNVGLQTYLVEGNNAMFKKYSDDLLVGKFVGSDGLGIYTRAYATMLLPIRQVTSVLTQVMFPALSKIKEDKKRVKRIYLKSNRIIGLITIPMMVGLAVVAEDFVLALYGPKWVAVTPVLQILCLVGVKQPLGSTTGWIFQSQGRTDIMFRWNIVVSIITVLSFIIGIQWGVIGVAWAYAIRSYVVWYHGMTLPGRLIDMTFWEFIKNVKSIFFISLLMAGCVLGVQLLLPVSWLAGIKLIVEIITGIVSYTGLIHLFKIKAYKDTIDLLKERFDRLKEYNMIK